MTEFRTDQERFWAGDFGDEYSSRNRGDAMLASNVALFARILARTNSVGSVMEFGANIGMNLRAIRQLLPSAALSAVEINSQAAGELAKIPGVDVHVKSMLDFSADRPRDFVLAKGVLIHLAPDLLPRAYDVMHGTSGRYLCVAEYYNPSPVEVSYRGHAGKLFKRDFAGEMLDRFADLALLDYGFAYRRDPCFPQDDITWFLLEKTHPGR